jgi:hypothetical protein
MGLIWKYYHAHEMLVIILNIQTFLKIIVLLLNYNCVTFK